MANSQKLLETVKQLFQLRIHADAAPVQIHGIPTKS